MRAPPVKATMERRILVNYRVHPDRLGELLPAPFRPLLVHGYAIGGICLIRLGDVRPAGLPPAVGVRSENAAHRIAVEWDTAAGPVTGVYIPRRHSSSRLTVLLGGRAFPGWHDHARFRVTEDGSSYRVQLSGRDVDVAVTAHRADRIMAGSVFATIDEASAFFCAAPIGYAATPAAGVYDGVELTTDRWAM
ncbi:MAG TPA: DUF2071 domain-containing protein, partial [Acidimicrobiales bacterium]|nr:DUF2071 domain-containing protein [Acidimicrobiales bacterium]